MGKNAYWRRFTPQMWRRFTPPATIFDYAEFILGVEAIDQK